MNNNKNKQNLMNGEQINNFTSEQLDAALFHAEDIMRRCNLYAFMLLEDTAKSIKEQDKLEDNKIMLGVRAAELTDTNISTLKTLAANLDYHVDINNFQETEQGYQWEFKGIPVVLRVIRRKFEFLKHPADVYYFGERYNIPNPFDKYYKARGIVR